MALSPDSQTDPYARDSSADVNAILQGMTDARIDQIQARRAALPAPLQPSYRPQLPPQLNQSQVGGPVYSPSELPPELSGTVLQPGQQPQGPNYTVTGTGPGTWWRQQQQNQPPIPPQFQQNQPPVSLQPQLQPPQQASLNPRDPGFRYTPPQNSERPPVNNMPLLWGANQRGPSGLTKQQFLTQKLMHESQGDPTALNYVARGDPRMYHPGTDAYGRPRPGYSASGLLQNINDTWDSGVKWALENPDRYPMYGDDPRKYPVAGYAPWQTQWQVNSAVYDHAGETPWNERGGPAGQSFKGRLADGFYNSMAEPTQQYAPAQPRSFAEWGRQPTGMGGTQPGEMPRHSDFGRIMGAVAPLLVGIASLALRLPLSTAITAYGAMTRAQQNGQQLDYQRQRTQWQDKLKEATAQQALESRAASDAFAQYGENNPEGLQQELAKIALQYNDPAMFRMAQQGDLNGIYQLQQRRDLHGQDLSKLQKAQEEEETRRTVNADIAARDKQWEQEHPDATPEERAIAHAQHMGQADQDVSPSKGRQETPGQEKTQAEMEGARARTDDWANAQDPPVKPGSNAYKEHLAEEVQRGTQARPAQEGPKSSDYKDYEWEGADDGKMHHGSAAIVPGKGLVDPQGQPINAKPGTINAIGTRAAAAGESPKSSDYKDYEWEDADDGKMHHGSAAIVPGKGLIDPQGNPINAKPGTINAVGTRAAGGTPSRFGTTDDLMQRWHQQFVQENGREPSTDEIAKQRQAFTQESKPPPMSSRQVSQRLGIAIGEAAGGVAALTQLSSSATLGPWGGAQASLSTGVYDNFLRSLTNRVTPEQAQMMNSIAKVIARPLASLEAAGVATGLVGVTQSLQTEFPQSGDSGYTVLTKLANIRNIVDAAEDMLARDKNLDPEIKKLIADNRAKVDTAIPYTLNDVVTAQVNPTKENMRGLAERLLHRSPTGQGGAGQGNLPPGVTVEVH